MRNSLHRAVAAVNFLVTAMLLRDQYEALPWWRLLASVAALAMWLAMYFRATEEGRNG
jgi:hypothetical protein